MHIDEQLLHLIIASIAGFLLGSTLLWLIHRNKLSFLLQQQRQSLQLQYDTDRKILELDLENFENEQDLLRGQLLDKEQSLSKKIDDLSRLNELKAIYATRAAQITDYKTALENSSKKLEELSEQKYQVQKKLSEIQIISDEKIKAAHLIIENLQQSKQELTQQFEHLAGKIFSANSQQLKQTHQDELNHLLTPFKEQFTDFKRKVEEIHAVESRDRVSLAQQVSQLSSLNQKISDDAINLTRALKGDVKVQGNWGEMVLENLMEQSGLRKDLEYKLQPSFRDDNKHFLRPDMVIYLPDNKTIIVDSKVSLKSYAQYVSAIDEDEQKFALKNHILSLKNHIKGLSAKDYSSINELHSLDFVLLFVPIEQALNLVINEQPELIFSAFKNKIILVSATTLLATVRTIENFWRYDKQQSNAEVIAEQAGDMLDKFVLFIEELENIGQYLDRAKSSYNTAHNRLFSGNGNLVSRAKNIQELGVKGKREVQSQIKESLESSVDSL